jgi:hypothetical protein
VNAKQLAHPVLQAGPSRCESGHGCQRWLNANCSQGVISSARRSAKAEVRGASPRESANSFTIYGWRNDVRQYFLPIVHRKSKIVNFAAPVPQQPQERFRKPPFVGASPTRGSSLRLPAPARPANFKSGSWCNSSISPREGDGQAIPAPAQRSQRRNLDESCSSRTSFFMQLGSICKTKLFTVKPCHADQVINSSSSSFSPSSSNFCFRLRQRGRGRFRWNVNRMSEPGLGANERVLLKEDMAQVHGIPPSLK